MTIKLINTKAGWIAKFEGDQEVIEAFGTDTIPTAYTSSASPILVKTAIKKLNPNHNVILI